MTYRLFIDDEREPIGDEWFVARSCDEAQTLVRAWGLPRMISFDHDLGDGPTGKDFANWLVDYMLDYASEIDLNGFDYIVHSQNPIGASNIRSLLDRYLENVRGEYVKNADSSEE